ncbi:hypothetical protein DID88_004561 [Monilinia fructigena]|uniref:FAD linked oxidase N-terminal domain-containing protein n=1 Tax=Monilinia fructigena TaxID=38457 RepID=A0A395ISW2_9HELO|nr:hypothetical protein DID88_004561 [Monilinia fructigena]
MPNANSIPFLTVNKAHGLTATLGRFNGLQLDMGLLRNIDIQRGGKTAIFQGGTFDGQVIDYLWDKGYVTTTGSCACVGMLGPGLGGDGSAITVSENSHSDLLWAMKGAGHNFGIVTSFELKIYPRLVDTWYYRNYVWKQDKLETLFGELNKLHSNTSHIRELAVNYGTYGVNASISSTEYFEAFDRIPAESVEDGNVPYSGIPDATGTGLDQPLCAKGYEHVHSTNYLNVWNITTLREVYDLFQSKITEQPLLRDSIVMLEDYSTVGVRAVDSRTSAFPWRDRALLTVTAINFPPNSSLDAYATEWANQNKDLINKRIWP